MAYKYILFDADDTLLDYGKSSEFALSKTFEDINCNYEDINCNYNECIANKFNSICDELWHEFKLDEPLNEYVQINYHDLYYKYSVEKFKTLKALLGIDISEELLSKKYLDSFSKCSFLVENAEDICKQLSLHYKIFIVTNGLSHIQKLRIGNSKIKSYITDILISEDAGCAKPGRSFFDYSVKKIGVSNLSEMLIVGDSLITDIFGGNEYGIDTCWFNSKGKINKLKIQPKFEIRELNELINIV